MKIITNYSYSPVPVRQFDWAAVTDDFRAGSPIGFGPTKADAIADLLRQLGKDDVAELSMTAGDE